jgi:basic amino acid/polyamine antiporter, APA family
MEKQPELKRTLSLWQLTLYGIGTTVGAGIYVLVGEVAALAGMWAPVSFMIAGVLAALTGLSFAELSSRFPYSASEAVYVQRAFNRSRVSMVIGLLVVLTAIISSATLVNGFTGYLREFVSLPDMLVITAMCVLLGAVAVWGIAQSVGIAVAVTVIEVAGLIAVVIVAMPDAITGEALTMAPQTMVDAGLLLGVLSGAGIAFYAYIGFEDMVNVAEEVKNARSVVPRAILITLVVTGLLYLAVAIVFVRAMPPADLTATDAPLASLFARTTGSSTIISVIALFAVINGALIQVVMAARVLYGEAKQGWLPVALARVNANTQTPVIATAVVTALILVFAICFPLGTLARLTSLIILVIFTTVNTALVRIKTRPDDLLEETELFHVPLWVPIAGALASSAFAVINVMELVK